LSIGACRSNPGQGSPQGSPRRRYQWQRQALENLAGAFSTPAANGSSKREKELVPKTKELEAKLAKKDNVIAEVAAELIATKKALGEPERTLVPHDIHDTIVDFVRVWSDKTEIAADRFVAWIGMARGKFFAWKKRCGKANEHNGHVPRDHWLLDEENRKIIAFHESFPLEGYRRLTFMMIDITPARRRWSHRQQTLRPLWSSCRLS
jgi:hypothetical protein